ncbi:Uncharacterised protein [Chlamydia trachomatis]|nr:Uncharacterised protein [Chlamydia trachomatis]
MHSIPYGEPQIKTTLTAKLHGKIVLDDSVNSDKSWQAHASKRYTLDKNLPFLPINLHSAA